MCVCVSCVADAYGDGYSAALMNCRRRRIELLSMRVDNSTYHIFCDSLIERC